MHYNYTIELLYNTYIYTPLHISTYELILTNTYIHIQIHTFSYTGPQVIRPKGNLNDFVENIYECAYCNEKLKTLKACGKCLRVRYCCRECQVSHWKAHKQLCSQLEAAASASAGRGK